MKTHQRRFKSAGFTLIELVMVILLLSILALGGSGMLTKSFSVSTVSNTENASYTESQYAMQRLANEFREIAFPAVATGACTAQQYCIYAPTALPVPSTSYAILNGSTFGFYNGTTLNSLSVSRTGNTVFLNSSALLQNVTALSLNFYDSNLSNSAPTVVNLRYVVINLTVTPSGVPAYSLRTRVALRNS